MLKLSKSTYYFQSKATDLSSQKNETDLIDHIDEIVCEFPGYCSRRVMKQLLFLSHKKSISMRSKCVFL